MKRLSQLCLLRPTTNTAAGATVGAALPRGALGLTGASATHTQVRGAGTQRRIVRPTEEGVADLMDDDDGISPSRGVHGGSSRESSVLSSLRESAALYKRTVPNERAVAPRKEGYLSHRGASDPSSDPDNERLADEDVDDAAQEQNRVSNSHCDAHEEGVDEDEEVGEVSQLLTKAEQEKQELIVEQQRIYYEMPVQEFTDALCAYLRSTENVALVSAEEEHSLFPVLRDRLVEFHVTQLLDVMECHWSRSTMLRYGTGFKDAVRDRIAQLATAAATQLEAKKHLSNTGAASVNRNAGDDTLPEEEIADDDAIFVQDQQHKQQQSTTNTALPADAILAQADKEITAMMIYRALVVTGMSAGRRKRDQVFFQLLGNYLTYFINDYRDPNDLVRVLTALARAKIVPSPAFLSLLARRLPVLHKRVPLQPSAAYRAMSNFARMGHTSMNTFRFLADCMLTHMEKNIREEKKQLRQLRKAKTDAAEGEEKTEKISDASSPPSGPDVAATPTRASSENKSLLCAQASNLRPVVAANERLSRICGLKPSNFTRLLLILARFNAPHQQYLRPLIHPVIIPMIPHFPPPSFSRLLKATQMFRSNDVALVEAYVSHVCDVLAPAGHLTRTDVLNLLHLLSQEDTPVPAQLNQFLLTCRDSLKSATSASTARAASPPEKPQNEEDSKNTPGKHDSASKTGTVTLLLRPHHMCSVILCIGAFQRRVDIPLEALTPLVELAEDFARHLAFLMELSVISLLEVDMFVELCERHQIPDHSGAIEKLAQKRRDVLTQPRSVRGARDGRAGAATMATADVEKEAAAEEGYYGQLDVDVRETFAKILLANDFNTYGSYRPLPGPLQVDFREELTKVSAFELLQSVDLFAKACPGALHTAPRMFLSRSLLEKVGNEGEVVVEEETNELVIRQPRAELLTREDLQLFVDLVERTPLEAVRNAPAMWTFIKNKAERLGVESAVETANERLRELCARKGGETAKNTACA